MTAIDTRTLTAVGAGDVQFVSAPRRRPAAGEVAGTTLASVLSPGTELSMAYPVEARYPFPLPLGYAAVFRIDEVGEDVTDREVGDIVMSMGPHATWQVMAASATIPVPDGLDPRVATFSRIMNIPLSALAGSRVSPGGKAGVIGLGLIGQLTARVLAAGGLDTVAADASDTRRGLIGSAVPTAQDLDEDAFALVVECSGHESNVLAAARALQRHGELVLAGVPWRRRDDTYFFDVGDLVFHRFLTLRSGWEWQVPLRADAVAGGHDMVAQFTTAMRWLADGTVNIDGLAESLRPDGIRDAYEAIRERRADALTYVVDWS